MKKDGDIRIIISAKDLCSYVMTVTQKSPKQYRFTFTSRLQNLSMDILTNIYMANDIYVGNMSEGQARSRCMQRRDLQYKVVTQARLLAYISQLALEQKAITLKQYQLISKSTTEIIGMAIAWVKSDQKRLGYM